MSTRSITKEYYNFKLAANLTFPDTSLDDLSILETYDGGDYYNPASTTLEVTHLKTKEVKKIIHYHGYYG